LLSGKVRMAAEIPMAKMSIATTISMSVIPLCDFSMFMASFSFHGDVPRPPVDPYRPRSVMGVSQRDRPAVSRVSHGAEGHRLSGQGEGGYDEPRRQAVRRAEILGVASDAVSVPIFKVEVRAACPVEGEHGVDVSHDRRRPGASEHRNKLIRLGAELPILHELAVGRQRQNGEKPDDGNGDHELREGEAPRPGFS